MDKKYPRKYSTSTAVYSTKSLGTKCIRYIPSSDEGKPAGIAKNEGEGFDSGCVTGRYRQRFKQWDMCGSSSVVRQNDTLTM